MKRSTKDKMANQIVREAEILAQAQSAADEGQQAAYEEADAYARANAPAMDILVQARDLVEAVNDMDAGFDKAESHDIFHEEEKWNPQEQNPETVIDEKIKEEQKDAAEEDFKDEIADSFV